MGLAGSFLSFWFLDSRLPAMLATAVLAFSGSGALLLAEVLNF